MLDSHRQKLNQHSCQLFASEKLNIQGPSLDHARRVKYEHYFESKPFLSLEQDFFSLRP